MPLPARARSIRAASAASAGLPMISSPSTTVVSAASTISSSLACTGAGFLFRDAQDVFARGFAIERSFIDIRDTDRELDPGRREQFRAARRSRCQHQLQCLP